MAPDQRKSSSNRSRYRIRQSSWRGAFVIGVLYRVWPEMGDEAERPNMRFVFVPKSKSTMSVSHVLPRVILTLLVLSWLPDDARLKSIFHLPRNNARQTALSLAKRHHLRETNLHARRARRATSGSASASLMMVLLLPGDTGGIVASLKTCFAFDGQMSVRICSDNSGGRRERISNGNCYVLALLIRRIMYEPIPVMALISIKHASSSISSPSSPSNGGSSE